MRESMMGHVLGKLLFDNQTWSSISTHINKEELERIRLGKQVS